MNMGDRIKELRKEKDMSMEELGAIVGVGKAAVHKWEHGIVKNLKRDIIHTLSAYFGVNPSYLMGMTDIREYKSKGNGSKIVPIVSGAIAAGKPILANDHIDDVFTIDSSVDADFIIKVKGSSMINAGILDGDLAFIRIQPEVENGQIAAVIFDGEEATLKRFYRENGYIKLVSENPSVPTKVFDKGDIRIVGKLVAVLNIR